MNNKILCIDDEESVLRGFPTKFRKDFELHLASNGKEGLEVFEKKRALLWYCPTCGCRKWIRSHHVEQDQGNR